MIKNSNIVITGASSGIGKRMLEMLSAAENGNRVIAASRSGVRGKRSALPLRPQHARGRGRAFCGGGGAL